MLNKKSNVHLYDFINHTKIPLVAETDILVVGAGSAGCIASLAASSGSYSVMLIERYGFPGGTSTQMLDTFYGFFTTGR
jgi:succinate dehydrogenase/fumarate reductase flavoprotein subunit